MVEPLDERLGWSQRILVGGEQAKAQRQALADELALRAIEYEYFSRMYRIVYDEFRRGGWGRLASFAFTLDTYHRMVTPDYSNVQRAMLAVVENMGRKIDELGDDD